ncbi:MAG: prepilin peptidase [Actinobacteria bacterium]|nr:prepilin peptidase [Actinomycetota bacterium]
MSNVLATALAAVIGLLLGSFANVAIHRWPRGGSVVTPRESYCPHCQQPIRARDNIPVVSWLLLRRRCRHCGEPIAARYPAVEGTTALLFTATAAVHGATWLLPALLVFVWALVVATAIDLEHRIIPNKLTYRLPLALLPLLVLAAALDDAWTDLLRALVAGLALPTAMLMMSELFRLLRGQSGFGMGDVKLAASIGLVVGYLGGWELVVFFYGTMAAGVVIVGALIAAGRVKLASRIPFGPYLALGSLVAVLAGEPAAGVLERWLGVP